MSSSGEMNHLKVQEQCGINNWSFLSIVVVGQGEEEGKQVKLKFE